MFIGTNYKGVALAGLMGKQSNVALQVGTAWVALFTVAPTISTSGTECPGANYVRQAFVNNNSNWTLPGSASVNLLDNAVAITFPTASDSSWGTVVAYALMDAPSGGNIIFSDALTVSKAIGNGDTPQFAINALQVTD